MNNLSRAVRQFERTFLSHTNPNEPPDDRKTVEDMMRYPRQPQQPSSPKEQGKLIATIVENTIYDAQGRIIDRKISFEYPEKDYHNL